MSTPTAEPRPSGLTFDGQDPHISPADDLFRYVNGQWLETHTIPADRSIDGAFIQLREDADAHVRDIIEDAPADSRIGALYHSFMDTERLNASGLAPLEEDLTLLRAVTTSEDLVLALAKLERTGVSGLLGAYVDQDAKDPTQYVIYFSQSGLSLPDEAYYHEPQHADTRAAFHKHVAAMFERTGLLQELPLTQELTPADAAEAIMALETAVAQHHRDAASNRDADKRYNPSTLAEIADNPDYQGFPIVTWLSTATDGRTDAYTGSVIINQPEFLTGATQVWAASDLAALSAWTLWQLLMSRADLLSEDISKANFAFFGTILSGAEEQRERWKRGVSLTGSLLGEEVGKEYVARHFPPTHKERMVELVDNLLEAYRTSIRTLEWMTPATREKALAKLDTFTVKVGYPDKWRDYSALSLSSTDLVGNYRQIAAFHADYEWQKLGKPVDRDEWFMHPQTVNAYYNPVMNEIVFPAAILQPPFFTAEADDAANYGGIGAVIGHEIGHGFDDQGCKYDGEGRLHNWWTEDDAEAFAARTARLVSQYDALTPTGLDAQTYHVNGSLTLGENIGDLGGLAIALLAYELSLRNAGVDGIAAAPVIDGLTGLQRVFYNWATVWRTKIRPEQAVTYLSIDPHSPAEFRCNQIVRNIPEFYEAFDVTEENAMWLPEEERVRIWR